MFLLRRNIFYFTSLLRTLGAMLIVIFCFYINPSKAEKPGAVLKILIRLPLPVKKQPLLHHHLPAFKTRNILSRSYFLKNDSAITERRQYKIEHSFDRTKPLPLFFLGFGEVAATHVASLIFLFLQPKEYTKWDYGFGQELLNHADERYRNAWSSPPIMDNDNWNTNWVAHPYVGGYYYNFIRTKGGTPLYSFLFTTFASTAWEYGVESMFEHPSIQDLWITPVLGAVVGEASHQITLLLVKNKFSVGEKLLVLLINPPYFFNHSFKVPTEKRRKQLRQWNINKEKTDPSLNQPFSAH